MALMDGIKSIVLPRKVPENCSQRLNTGHAGNSSMEMNLKYPSMLLLCSNKSEGSHKPDLRVFFAMRARAFRQMYFGRFFRGMENPTPFT